MREIKFRVWDNRHEIMMKLSEVNTYSTIDIISNVFKESLNVMQFTGLKDKNSVEIYEGDIIDFGYTPTRKIVGEVVYNELDFDNPCFCLKDEYECYQTFRYKDDVKDWVEVIGNVYENPELIEESKDVN